MATLLGSLLVSLGMESAQFKRGANDAQKRMAQLGNTMRGIGASLSVAVTAPLVLFGKSALTAGTEAREAFAQVEQALTTMGGASGKTAEQLKQSAQELATFSNFNRTDILGKVTANLLTFGNVSGEVFDRAQQAAVDLSARLGQDLQSSAIQLGKALNDPLKGITALSRVGVSFTEEQKAMIKAMTEAGDVAGAQGLILSELEKQYGGAAKAARDAAPGGDQIQAWRELQEAVGERLVVAFGELERIVAPIIRSFLSLDEKTQTIVVVFGAIAAAVGPLLVVLGGFVTLAPAIAAGFAAMSAAALPVAAVVAAVAAAGYLIYQNWDKIGPVLDDVAEGFQNAIGPDLKRIIDEVSAKLSELWNGPLGEALRTVGRSLLDFQLAYGSVLGEGLKRVLDAAINIVGGAMNNILLAFTAVSRFLSGDFAGAWQALKEIAANTVRTIANVIEALFPGLIQMGKDIIRGVVNGIKAAPGAVRDALLGVIKSGVDSVKDFLGIKSPSRLFYAVGGFIMEGLANGIRDGKGALGEALETIKDQSEVTTVRVADTFAQMAQSVVSSLQGLANSIRSGDFLGILGGVIDIFTKLGSAGVFGKGLQGTLTSVPGFANGTRSFSGGLAVVGERGPELVNMPRRSQVIPNHKLGGMGGGIAQIVPSPYFDVVVDGRIIRSAPIVANAGAMQAQAMGARAARRSVR